MIVLKYQNLLSSCFLYILKTTTKHSLSKKKYLTTIILNIIVLENSFYTKANYYLCIAEVQKRILLYKMMQVADLYHELFR
jgi:hypothetical protein